MFEIHLSEIQSFVSLDFRNHASENWIFYSDFRKCLKSEPFGFQTFTVVLKLMFSSPFKSYSHNHKDGACQSNLLTRIEKVRKQHDMQVCGHPKACPEICNVMVFIFFSVGPAKISYFKFPQSSILSLHDLFPLVVHIVATSLLCKESLYWTMPSGCKSCVLRVR